MQAYKAIAGDEEAVLNIVDPVLGAVTGLEEGKEREGGGDVVDELQG